MPVYFTKTRKKCFENCISLGWFCGTASAMSYLGLRNYSGPFDWCFTDYRGVLSQIDNGFNDFMNKKNMVISKDNPKDFEDIKYKFFYKHDVKQNFEDEFEEIKSKYIRRVIVFKKMASLPTVFLRTVRDNEEINFINNNWKYAENLIKQYNPNNVIIYVVTSEMDRITNNVEFYRLNIPKYIGKTYEMRHLFDSCQKLLIRCSNLIDDEKVKGNLYFDKNKYGQTSKKAYIFHCIEKKCMGGAVAIVNSFQISKYCGVYLWGAGKNGLPLAKYLRSCGVNVKGIIDNHLAGKNIEGEIILSFDDVPNDSNIFISVSSKEANIEIEKQISESKKRISYRKYEDLDIVC